MAQKINAYQNGGWWEELGRNVLTTGGASLSVTLPVSRKYLKILTFIPTQTGGVNTNEYIRFNGDAGTNYDHRTVIAGAASTLSTAQVGVYGYGDTASISTGEWIVYNLASSNKPVFGKRQVSYPNGGSGLTWVDISGVWRNATTPITSVQYITTTGAFAVGSELIILGHD